VVAAPLDPGGRVNLASKGLNDTFHAQTVWYEDITGSGIETTAHLRENGRITILFNAFEGPPCIVRLLRKVRPYSMLIVAPNSHYYEYNSYIAPDTRLPGFRAAIKVDVHKVGTSCGYSVPFFEFSSH
ncbi:hypothetical protein BDZ89DRAFT_884487, partial [Hymenopellis radicata]